MMKRLDERAQFATPGSDRVRDGRQLMLQHDAVFTFTVHTLVVVNIEEQNWARVAVIERVGDTGV